MLDVTQIKDRDRKRKGERFNRRCLLDKCIWHDSHALLYISCLPPCIIKHVLSHIEYDDLLSFFHQCVWHYGFSWKWQPEWENAQTHTEDSRDGRCASVLSLNPKFNRDVSNGQIELLWPGLCISDCLGLLGCRDHCLVLSQASCCVENAPSNGPAKYHMHKHIFSLNLFTSKLLCNGNGK